MNVEELFLLRLNLFLFILVIFFLRIELFLSLFLLEVLLFLSMWYFNGKVIGWYLFFFIKLNEIFILRLFLILFLVYLFFIIVFIFINFLVWGNDRYLENLGGFWCIIFCLFVNLFEFCKLFFLRKVFIFGEVG